LRSQAPTAIPATTTNPINHFGHLAGFSFASWNGWNLGFADIRSSCGGTEYDNDLIKTYQTKRDDSRWW